jgi:23S rRNA (uracil1939-C5)-methyltransferase
VLPQEQVEAVMPPTEVQHASRKPLTLQLAHVTLPHPHRVIPRCPISEACGGCDWQHIQPEAQASHKLAIFKETLTHLGGISSEWLDTGILKPVLATKPWGYRNHFQWHVAWDTTTQQPLLGFKGAKSHCIHPYEACHVIPTEAQVLYRILHAWLTALPPRLVQHPHTSIHTFDVLWEAQPQSKNGLTHVALGCLSLAPQPFKGWYTHMNQLQEALQKEGLHLTGAYWHTSRHSASAHTWGETELVRLLTWEAPSQTQPTPQHTVPHEMTVSHKLHQFFQVNPLGLSHMLQTLQRWATLWQQSPLPPRMLYDLYAGVGVFGQLWLHDLTSRKLFLNDPSPRPLGVLGVEANQQSAVMAKQNWATYASQTQPTLETHFMALPIEKALPLIQKQCRAGKLPYPEVVILDPPRAGLSPTVKTWLHQPPETLQHLVLVSCDMATLARDLKDLLSNTPESVWCLREIQPIDMFPQTHHLEAMVWLTRG